MPDVAKLTRRSSIDLSHEALLGGVTLAPKKPLSRFILRGDDAADIAGATLGLSVPRQPNRAAAADERAALWLGPDEWLILAPAAEGVSLLRSLAPALAGVPHALVDVSDRQTGILVGGPGACDVLNTAVPLDLADAAFPVGMATRTIFAKAEIVLWRTDASAFHIEAERSFAPYVLDLLQTARRENHTG